MIEREKYEEARELIAHHSPLLSHKGRKWIEGVFQGDDEFKFALERFKIPAYSIEEVCEQRVFMDTGVPTPRTRATGRDDGAEIASDEDEDQCLMRALVGEMLEGEGLWHTDADEQRAQREFFGDAGMEGADDMQLDAYVQWYLHSFRDDATGRTLVEHFWENQPRKLAPREEQIVEAFLASYVGLFAVDAVHSGESVEVRNCASGDTLFLPDENAALELRRGDWVLTRVMELDGELRFLGCGLVVPARLREACGQFIQDKAQAEGETPDQLVRRCGLRLHGEIAKLRKSRKKAVKR